MAPENVVVVVAAVGLAGVEGAPIVGAAFVLTGVLKLPRERPVEPVSVPPRPLRPLDWVPPSLSVLLAPNNDPPPKEVDPVREAVAGAAVSGFVSVRVGFTSVAVVVVAAVVVPSGFEVDPVLKSEVPVERPPRGAVVVVFSGVVVDEKKDVIPGCLPPAPRPFAAGAAAVVVLAVPLPRPLVRLEKLLALGKED